MDIEGFIAGILIVLGIIYLGIIVLLIVSKWKLYEKANQPGWAVFIPVYTTLVMLQIVGKPWWWIFLLMLPFANIVFLVWMTNMLSKSFGKDEAFTAGLVLLPYVFYPILAFSDTKYLGPAGTNFQYDTQYDN